MLFIGGLDLTDMDENRMSLSSKHDIFRKLPYIRAAACSKSELSVTCAGLGKEPHAFEAERIDDTCKSCNGIMAQCIWELLFHSPSRKS